MIYRPLISSTFVEDIKKFINLDCNRHGVNLIIFSAHGRVDDWADEPEMTRIMKAFDGEIDFGREMRKLKGKLSGSIIFLDVCNSAEDLFGLYPDTGALGILGFVQDTNWSEAPVFLLTLLTDLYQGGALDHVSEEKYSNEKRSDVVELIQKMISKTYKH